MGRRLTPYERAVRTAVVALLTIAITLALARWGPSWPVPSPVAAAPIASPPGIVVVRANGSIADALKLAQPGSQVVVEPGEYREQLVLKDGVRVISRVPRGATIRLPGTASEADPAVVATDVSNAEFVGFRIVGDAATPLGTGVLVKGSHVSIVDVEVTGAVVVAIDLIQMTGGLTGSDIHDNPGSGLAIRSGASPRIAHNVFARNGLSERARTSLVIDGDAEPSIVGNVFQGVTPKAFQTLVGAARLSLMRENWFPDDPGSKTPAPATARGRQGR